MATHAAFSDDSKHEAGRYNSLSVVTLEIDEGRALSVELRKLIADAGLNSEFKWSDLSSATHRRVAEQMIDFTLRKINQLRIDVLIWDNHDSRHAIVGRDDTENLVRMYYHLIATTLSRRWPIDKTIWVWLPDQQSSVHWPTLQACLRAKKHSCVADLFGANPAFERVNVSVKPAKSHERVFIQLADLFAGMDAYSWGHFTKYQKWEHQQKGNHLFGEQSVSLSRSERQRFPVLQNFREKCRTRDMKIGLTSSRGLRSHDPRQRINFWPYEPQHRTDKAPVRHKPA
jgi:hypothetical protein